MPHLSKRELNTKTEEKLYKQLIEVLVDAHFDSIFADVMEDLLTPTEKLMFAKRIAIVLMLFSAIPQSRIAEALHVSPTTVSKIATDVDLGKFNALKAVPVERRADLEEIVWLIASAGGIMPPRFGGKYWRKKGYKGYLEKGR